MRNINFPLMIVENAHFRKSIDLQFLTTWQLCYYSLNLTSTEINLYIYCQNNLFLISYILTVIKVFNFSFRFPYIESLNFSLAILFWKHIYIYLFIKKSTSLKNSSFWSLASFNNRLPSYFRDIDISRHYRTYIKGTRRSCMWLSSHVWENQ